MSDHQIGAYERRGLLRLAAGKKVNNQTIEALRSRGLLTFDEYGSIVLTEAGRRAALHSNNAQIGGTTDDHHHIK